MHAANELLSKDLSASRNQGNEEQVSDVIFESPQSGDPSEQMQIRRTDELN